jgi:transposase
MSNIRFSEEQIENLRKNPNVKNVTELGITYTLEFKEHFIEENGRGKLPRTIFEEGGFESEMLGKKRMNSAKDRWCAAEMRPQGLRDLRKDSSGRPRTRELTPAQMIAKLKAENEYLKQMLEFRQELERLERQVAREERSGRKGNSK